MIDVQAQHEAQQPERRHEQEHRDEGQEGLVDDRRDARRQADDGVPVGEQLLHPHADERDHDGGEEAPGADGSPCVWVQPVASDGRLTGAATAALHLHGGNGVWGRETRIGVTTDRLFVLATAVKGDVWSIELGE